MPEPERRLLCEDHLDYTPSAGSVRLARLRTARIVGEEWSQPGLAGDAAIIVSELATNAMFHGRVEGRLFRVRLGLTAGAVRIEVSDACGERMPEPRLPGDEETGGRGLLLVGSLSSRWGTRPRIVGKTVWAELDLPPTP
nr:ATP-binding protein [Streptomyces sp. RFCAC02]